MSDKESREEKIEKLKKSYKERPSARPMGYVYPGRIHSVMHGETPVIKTGWSPEMDKDFVPDKPREIGEKWIDDEGNEWQQCNGYTMKLPKYLDEINKVVVCPKCGKTIDTELDKKFFVLRNNCFDCQIKYETHLRAAGGWKEYEEETLKANYISFLKDSKIEIEEFLKNLKNKEEYVTEDGTIEKWEGDTSKVREFFMNELNNINEALINLEKGKEDGPREGAEVKESN